ncbi:MAG: VCBS repeat-containing protein [Alphaproteobacteria bacterium]|nr:VCBS repeat-containing protein [Alphaproteobacteria bacterium]
MRTAIVAVAASVLAMPCEAADWVLQPIPTVGPVKAIETVEDGPIVLIGGGWFRPLADGNRIRMVATAGPPQFQRPPDALPDSRVAEGKRTIARAWLAEPTGRYGHGVLGDAVEAGSVVVERSDRRRETVSAGPDAVFEDLEPRLADLGGDGRDRIVVVKSYLQRGSALAVIGERDGRYTVVAETPPIGTPNRWLNPAGIADFDGDGAMDIALVRMPHALGRLELWSWRDGGLHKTLELPNVSNHAIGSRALRLSAVADFDGDGKPDLAIPSFDRRSLRLIAFGPQAREIARIALPARATTDFALLKDALGWPAVLLGLENGALVLARRATPRG